MSTINKKPIIETILGRMSLDELDTLLDLMNGEDQTPTFITLINRTGDHVLSTDDKGVSFVNLCISTVRAQTTLEGYLIYNDTDCALVHFTGNKNQNLSLLVIDPTKLTCEFVNEPMTVVGLRSEVKDCLTAKGGNVKVQVDDIESNGEIEGKAIISDGEGGAKWGTPGMVIEGAAASLEADLGGSDKFNAFMSSLRAGDHVYLTEDGLMYEVGVGEDGSILFKAFNGTDSIIFEIYKYYPTTGNYSYDKQEIKPLGGTKLYKHTLSSFQGASIILINTSSASLTNKYDDFINMLINGNYIQCFVNGSKVGMFTNLAQGGGGSSAYSNLFFVKYNSTSSAFETSTVNITKTTEFTDTVTDL